MLLQKLGVAVTESLPVPVTGSCYGQPVPVTANTRDTGAFPLAVDHWSLHSGSVLSWVFRKPIVQVPPPYLHILYLPSIVPRRVNFTMSPFLPKSL